jgi:hypothetical protein
MFGWNYSAKFFSQCIHYIYLSSIRICFEVISEHLVGKIEENYERPRTVQPVSRREETPGPFEYEAAILAT